MLTVISLVVLGGGVGFAAVLLSGGGPRRSAPGRTPPSLRAPASDAIASPASARVTPPTPARAAPAAQDPSPDRARITTVAGPMAVPSRAHGPGGATVPRSLTAVEGTWAEVGRASLPRRVVSLSLLVGVLAGLTAGVTLALGAAAAIGSALLDGNLG